MVEQIVFYTFSSVAILAALWMVIAKNPVRAVLSMVLAFVSMSAVWLLLQSEFLAISLVLVYVGAVMVLFLFVVMMLEVDVPTFRENFVQYLPIGALIAAAFLGLLLLALSGKTFSVEQYPIPDMKPEDYSHVKALGALIYTEFLLPFEVAGVLLLSAMIGAIALTFRGTRRTKRQNISAQVETQKSDRLQIIKMPPETGWNEE